MRVVVDTNVWISALLSPAGSPARIARAMTSGRFEPVVCGLTLAEFSDVARRPRLRDRYGLDEAAVVDLEMALVAAGVHLDDPDAVPTSRDPRDDVFIALAVAANAEYLVTRDDDLKGDAGVRAALGEAGVQLVTVREFVAILEGEEVAPN